ncbi:STAR protein, partial [Nothoprocta ornata]|nr:STAR protein [Nothoprocta ornata]
AALAAMLRATAKLCCGIAHDALRRLPGDIPVPGRSGASGHGGGNDLAALLAPTDARLEVTDAVGSSPLASAAPSASERALQSALRILQQQRGWRAESTREAGAAVASAVLPGLGRVFRAEAVLRAPPARLQRELFDNIERMPEWYPALGRVQVGAGGTRRGRGMRRRAGLTGRPRRAESRLSCMVLQPLDGDPGQTRLTWLLCVDLKGWIPTSVLQRALPQSQADFIGRLRRRLAAPARP